MHARQLSLVSLSLAIVFTLLVSAGGASAQGEGMGTVEKVTALFVAWNGRTNPTVFRQAANLIDYEEMSEKALNSHWNKLDAHQKREFVSVFQQLIEDKYYKRWHRIFSKGKLKHVKDAHSGGDLLVTTTLSVGKKQDTLIWRLSNKTGDYRVVSLSVDEKDLLNRVSGRLEKQMTKGGFKRLISWMKDEADIEDDDSRS